MDYAIESSYINLVSSLTTFGERAIVRLVTPVIGLFRFLWVSRLAGYLYLLLSVRATGCPEASLQLLINIVSNSILWLSIYYDARWLSFWISYSCFCMPGDRIRPVNILIQGSDLMIS